MASVEAETGRIALTLTRHAKQVRQGFTRFRSGDLLFAKITPCMENGKIAIVPVMASGLGCGSTEFHVIEPINIEPKFLYHWLNQRSFRQEAEFHMTGSAGQKRVPTRFMIDAPLPVPPRDVQRQIVARMHDLLSDLDDGEVLLERACDDLGTWRKALLKAAVTGELTADWRTTHPPSETGADLLARTLDERRARWLAEPRNKGKRYTPPTSIERSELQSVPSSWTFASLPQLGDFGRGKSKHRPRDDARLYGGQYPFVQTGIVAASRGRIEKFDQTYTEFGVAQSKIWPKGTLCITIAANIAKTGVLQFDACFPDSVVGLTCADGILSEYVELIIRSFQTDLEDDAPATAQKNINLETLTALPIPLPPSDEQRAIVAAHRSAEIVGESVMNSDLELTIAMLRQCILSAAFRGELVA